MHFCFKLWKSYISYHSTYTLNTIEKCGLMFEEETSFGLLKMQANIKKVQQFQTIQHYTGTTEVIQHLNY